MHSDVYATAVDMTYNIRSKSDPTHLRGHKSGTLLLVKIYAVPISRFSMKAMRDGEQNQL
jgi:hypothetical protein